MDTLRSELRLLSSSKSGSNDGTCKTSSSSSSSSVHAHEAVLFPFLAVLIGCMVTWVTPRYKYARIFPYTVWLFLIGILMGILDLETKEGLGNLSESMSMWLNIDPHVLLYTFLPVLLFGDSMNINYHEFTRCAAQCVILAGPGVLMGTGLMYVVAKYIFPFDWTTNEAAAFASILAATDPVAVVALLNQMGACRTLTMQIAGESLLNDGMAIVVWTLFFEMMQGKDFTVMEIIGKFCKLAIGGVFFGLVVGVITLRGLLMSSDKLIHSDHMVQMALTFAAAYLAYYIGENELKVSGVLSTIFAALVLGKAAWPVMCSGSSVQQVWHTAEFFGNTVLFTLCGLVFYESTKTVDTVDWLWLMLLYVLASVARGLMFLVLYPLLNSVATSKASQIGWRESIIMTWGGLRGAVGLALALSMRSQLRTCNKTTTGNRIVFFVGGFAGLTLVINASTCGRLLQKLELTKPPEAREKLLETLQEELLDIAREECRQLTEHDRRFAAVKYGVIDKILLGQLNHHADGAEVVKEETQMAIAAQRSVCPAAKGEKSTAVAAATNGCAWNCATPPQLLTQPVSPGGLTVQKLAIPAIPSDSTFDPQPTLINRHSVNSEHGHPMETGDGTHWWWGFDPIEAVQKTMNASKTRDLKDVADSEVTAERHFYLSMLRAQYQKQAREDMIPMYAEGAVDLTSSIDRSTDWAHTALKDWEMLQKEMLYTPTNPVRILTKVAGSEVYSPYAPMHTKDGHIFDLFTVVVFLDAHHLVCARLACEKSLSSTARSCVVTEAAREVEEAHGFLKENEVGPRQIGVVRTKQLLAVLYARQLKQVHKWLERGIINDMEAEELIHPVHHCMKEVRDIDPSGGGANVQKRGRGRSPFAAVSAVVFGRHSKHYVLDTE